MLCPVLALSISISDSDDHDAKQALSAISQSINGQQCRCLRSSERGPRRYVTCSLAAFVVRADVGFKAGMQATAFMNNAGNKVASESKGFVQGFSLPGEAEKAAKILQSFLGVCSSY